MGKSAVYQRDVLALEFQNIAAANIGNAGGLQPSSAAGNFYISLHSADPTASSGYQTVNETTYTNYTRQPVARSSAGWTLGASPVQISNAAQISFPQCGASGQTVSYGANGTASGSSNGMILYSGSLGSPLAIANLITPIAAIGGIVVTES